MLICGGWDNEDNVELLKYEKGITKHTSSASNTSYLRVFMPSCLRPATTLNRALSSEVYGETMILCKRNIYPTKLPLIVSHHTLTNIGYDKVMLVGGEVDIIRRRRSCSSNRVFQGKLTPNKKDVKWIEVGCLSEARGLHISFKLNDSVYVAGGVNEEEQEILSSCERYDLTQNK